jgi:hypothetical protein
MIIVGELGYGMRVSSDLSLFKDIMTYAPMVAIGLKMKYCKGDQRAGVGYAVKQAEQQVPAGLYPHQTDQARQLLL